MKAVFLESHKMLLELLRSWNVFRKVVATHLLGLYFCPVASLLAPILDVTTVCSYTFPIHSFTTLHATPTLAAGILCFFAMLALLVGAVLLFHLALAAAWTLLIGRGIVQSSSPVQMIFVPRGSGRICLCFGLVHKLATAIIYQPV